MAAVIGQHPQCYGLPELDLFPGDTLGEAQDAYARTGRSVFIGLRRTIAELHHGAQTVETVDAAAKWLNISTAPDAIEKMLHPESSPYSCIGPENAPFGANPGFLENPALDFEKLALIFEPNLDAPMEWAPGHNFSQDTRNLAASYGYR